jgi:hypothetical protein
MEHLRHPLKSLSRSNTSEEDEESTLPKRADTFPVAATATNDNHEPHHQQLQEQRTATPPIPIVTKANTTPLGPSHSSHSSTTSSESTEEPTTKPSRAQTLPTSATSAPTSVATTNKNNNGDTTKRQVKHSPESFYAAIHEGNSNRTTLAGAGKRRERRASKTSIVDSASLLGV